MEASIRNALGDIGNRIGLGNVQLAALGKNDAVMANKNHQQQPSQQFRFTKTTTTTKTMSSMSTKTATSVKQQQQTTTTTTVVAKAAEPELMTMKEEEEKPANNSCVMLEEDEEEDIELGEESDEEDDEDIMYSDAESDEQEIEQDEDEVDESILDIDALDTEDPQLCADYVREIYKYMTHMERKYRIAPTFLEKKMVTSRMRAVLIDWLIQVHMKFQLLQETMYLTVYFIDSYLQRMDVSKMHLQLVGVTAMFLASKYEEMYVPAIEDFVYMTDNTYTKSEIRKMEVNMCKTLDFGFGKPLPLHFLRRFSKAAQADPKQHTLAKYLMELSLHDAEFSSMDPSLLAAASLHLSLQLLNGPKWNKTMEYYSGYKSSDLQEAMAKLANLTLKSMDINYKYRAATNKYGTSKFMRISLIPELNGKFMRDLAAKVAQ